MQLPSLFSKKIGVGIIGVSVGFDNILISFARLKRDSGVGTGSLSLTFLTTCLGRLKFPIDKEGND